VRDRRTLEVQLDQVLFRLFDALLDRHGNFASLAHTEASVAVAIADNDESRKAQVLAALDNFRNAVNCDDIILQIGRIHFQETPNRQTFA
jgi:hypothetical protein